MRVKIQQAKSTPLRSKKMTQTEDPLLDFLHGELDQIEQALAFDQQLGLPVVPLTDSHAETLTYSWSYRYTWQEVERGRRYVIPLDRQRARTAQRPIIEQIAHLVTSQAESDPTDLALPVSDIRRQVSFRAGLNAYSVSESIRVGPLQPLQL